MGEVSQVVDLIMICHVEGGTTTTDWFGMNFNSDCPNVGHIVFESPGYMYGYGISIASATTSCSKQTLLASFNSDFRRNLFARGHRGWQVRGRWRKFFRSIGREAT